MNQSRSAAGLRCSAGVRTVQWPSLEWEGPEVWGEGAGGDLSVERLGRAIIGITILLFL